MINAPVKNSNDVSSSSLNIRTIEYDVWVPVGSDYHYIEEYSNGILATRSSGVGKHKFKCSEYVMEFMSNDPHHICIRPKSKEYPRWWFRIQDLARAKYREVVVPPVYAGDLMGLYKSL